MKIFIPEPPTENPIGGGFSFLRNFKKAIAPYVEFSDLQSCDLVFIPGVTMVERDEIEQAHNLGKAIVFRMDNIPRKSRNKRNRVYDNITRYAEICDLVIYQSEWAANYCEPMSGKGTVIHNGVDQDIFNAHHLVDSSKPTSADRENNYLFVYHGKSELKQFWVAHYIFQMEARKNPNAKFYFIYNFKSELRELQEANFDFWNGEKFEYIEPTNNPEVIANLMKQCKYLIFPSICDAAPNTILEARACGMEFLGIPPDEYAGTRELLNLPDISLDRMAKEYSAVFQLCVNDAEIET